MPHVKMTQTDVEKKPCLIYNLNGTKMQNRLTAHKEPKETEIFQLEIFQCMNCSLPRLDEF